MRPCFMYRDWPLVASNPCPFRALNIFCSDLYDYGYINLGNYHFTELKGQGLSCHLIPFVQTIIIPVVAQDENTRNFSGDS